MLNNDLNINGGRNPTYTELSYKGLPHVFELINLEGLHETVQTLRSELERVDELESVHSEGEILYHVLWNFLRLPKSPL